MDAAEDGRRWSLPAMVAAALVCAAACGVLLLRGAGTEVANAGPAAAPTLDHFQCYSAKFDPNAPVNAPIALRDQFSLNPIKHTVGAPRFFCNPVQKIHDATTYGIVNPNNHLTAYQLNGRVPPKKLFVKNQFQTPAVGGPPNLVLNPGTTTNPTRPLILVPTRKAPHDNPKELSHFKCYPTKQLPVSTINKTVVLNDQFLSRDATVLTAVLLCNPAKKWHGGTITPIVNPKAHLVCYTTSRHAFPAGQEPTRRINNQFAKHKMTALVARMLCVPSEKRIAT